MNKAIGRVLLSLSIVAGALLPVAPGVFSVANANEVAVAPAAAADQPGLTPTFGARVPDYYAPGFKHQITNYDPAYTWTVTTTVGTASINSSGLVSVGGVGDRVSATVTVTTSRSGYTSASASVTSVGPWNLSPEIQAQNITATLSGTTLTVNVPDNKGWKWSLIWSGGVQRTNIFSFPVTVDNFTPNREIQLGATDSLDNFGYSTMITPAAAAPVNLPGLTPTFGPRTPDYNAPGFKHQITNYDPAYTWTVAATVGTASISPSGLISVAGVGARISSTVTVTTNRTGYNSASASVTSVGPWNLSEEIQAQNITATLSGTTLTVNVPDNKGWKWTLAWDNQSKFTNLTFPYSVPNFPPNKQIQLYAEDNLVNFGYSRMITPTVAAPAVVVPEVIFNSGTFTTGVSAGTIAPGRSFGISWRVTKNDQVASTVALIDGSGNSASWVGGALVSGTVQDGTYQGNLSVPSGFAVGRYLICATAISSTDRRSASQCGGRSEYVQVAVLEVIAAALQAQTPLTTIVSTPLRVGSTAELSTVGGSGTGRITYTSLTTSTCTVSGRLVTARLAGRCGILAIKAGDSTFSEANVGTNFTVSSASLLNQATITGNLPLNLLAGQSGLLSSTGGTGLGAVTFTSETPSICTVSGTTLFAIAAGNCTVTTTKAADSNYNSASSSRIVTIGSASLQNQVSLVFLSIPAGLGVGTTGNFQVSGGSGTGALTYTTTTSSICSVSGTQVRGLATGTCTLVATKAADSSFLAATTSINLAIGKAAQASLSFSVAATLRPGATISLFAGGGSGTGAITFSTVTPSFCGISGTTLTALAAGTCRVTATKASDANFQAVSADSSIVIQGLQDQSPLVLSIPGLPTGSINVGGFYGATISGGSGSGSVTFSTSTPSVCALSGTANPRMFPFQIEGLAPGTCTVTIRKAGDSDNLEATVTRSYTVGSVLKNQLPIVVEPIAPVNVGESAEIKASGGSGTGTFDYSSITQNVCTVSGTTVNTRALGTCSISVRKNADSEFLVNTAAYSFTVRAGKPTVRFSPAMTPGQTVVGSFYVSANGSVSTGSSAKIAQVCLTMDGSPVTSGEDSNSSGYYWSNGYSSSSRCFNVSGSSVSNTSYRWLLESKNFEPGLRTLNVTVVDSEGNRSDSASISVVLKSTKPTIQVLSPSMGSVVKGKMKISFSVTTAQEAGRYIRYIGVSEENALPAFSGAYSTWSSPFSSGFKAFSIGSSISSGTYTFEINTQKFQKGLRTFKVAVQDSNGDIAEASVSADVQALKPTVQILSPSSGQTFEGVVSVKVQASTDPSSAGGEISYIGIDNSQLTPEFAGVEQNSAAAGFPSNYRTWQVNDVRNFTFTAAPGSLKNGLIRLNVLIADDTKASAIASVDFTVSTANPTAVIISPVAGTIMPGVITLTAETKPNPVSGGRIVAIAISEKNAQPAFFGAPVFNSSNSNISRNYALWSVDDVQKPSWKIDTTGWDPGDRIITVVTQDSYGKVGQGTVVLNIPPKGTFTSTLAGPPVLGRSVPISVEMRTNAPYRSAPAVVVTLQSSPTEAGPWKDLGDITLDATGKGSGSVVVTAKLWVRALHKQLDAVQPGVGAPLRIVNVPDPNRTNTTSGDENPDGSRPKVTCVPKSNTKVGRSVSISCSQIDVQDPSQPMTLFVQQRNKFVKASNAMFRDGFIMSSFTSRSKGKLTFQVRGLAPEDSNYVAWKSNMFTITWS